MNDVIDVWVSKAEHPPISWILEECKARLSFESKRRRRQIAQAQWFSNSHKSFEVPPQLLALRMSFEAQALKANAEKRWTDAIAACHGRSALDPISTRPLAWGSYIAESALNNGRIALEFTSRWVVTEPTSSMAWNNHAVALAYVGKIEEAKAALSKVTRADGTTRIDAVLLATEGLIEYRSGHPDAGRNLYMRAAESDLACHDRALHALIIWHLLREEARWNVPATQGLVHTVWEKIKDVPLGELAAMKQLIERGIVVHFERNRQAVRLGLKKKGRETSARQDQAHPLGWKTSRNLSVAYETLARRYELAALSVRDMDFHPDGTGQALIRRGKTDAVGQGRVAYLSRSTVRWLKIWIEQAEISEGAVFRRLIGTNQIGGPLNSGSIAPIFKWVAQWIGMPARTVAKVSGHSTRVGATQDLAALDIDLGRSRRPEVGSQRGRRFSMRRKSMRRDQEWLERRLQGTLKITSAR